MKNIFIYIILFAMMTTGSVSLLMAQNKKAGVEGKALIQKGDSLYINVLFDASAMTIKSNQSIEYIPVLTDGQHRITLPKVMFCGRERYIGYRRKLRSMSFVQKWYYKKPYAVVKSYNKRAAKAVDYRYALRFEAWMCDAKLLVEEDACGCGRTRKMNSKTLISKVELEQREIIASVTDPPAVIVPKPTRGEKLSKEFGFVRNIEDYPADIGSWATSSGKYSAIVYFNQGSSSVGDIPENAENIATVANVIDEISGSQDSRIAKIVIAGYASPEGSAAINEKISTARAHALMDALARKCNFKRGVVEICQGGIDWTGLREMVEASEMQYKQEVLNIIDDTPANKGRNYKLMGLKRGNPYHYMMQHFFPRLRRASCIRVYYQDK